MILVCKDFTFDDKTLCGQNFMSVNFDDDTSLPSSIVRQIDAGEMNKYRVKKNDFGITYSDVLEFEIHIVKDFDEFTSQEEMEVSEIEYRSLISWLSSPQTNKWLSITKENNSKVEVFGYFSSIEPYDNWGICYGAKCVFTCNSPFSYAKKEQTNVINNISNILINNQSDEYYDYVYPTFLITPTKNEDIFIHNLSDTEILDNGQFQSVADSDSNIMNLQAKIADYASLNNLSIEYMMDDAGVKTICNNTGLSFYMTDSYGIKKKYIAYYLSSDNQYFICRGGFFYCTLSQGLNISMDCENLGIYDSLERPVLFDKINIQDEDEIYWIRLIHGNNSFRLFGNFTIKTSYLEPQKGALI